MQSTTQARPQARTAGLVVKAIGDEVMVYDKQRDTAHCLNPTAALVWHQCDGQRTVPEIAQLVETKLAKPVDEQLVWYALGQLNQYELLQERVTLPTELGQMSRREFMRKVKIAAVIALPLIISATAPTPAHAGSCLPSGSACTSGGACCSGLCNGGVCA